MSERRLSSREGEEERDRIERKRTHRRLVPGRFVYRNWISLPLSLGPGMTEGKEEMKSEKERIGTREGEV